MECQPPPYTFLAFRHNAMQTTERRFNLGLKQTSDIVVNRHETAGVSTWDCLPLSVQGVSDTETTAQNSEHSNCSHRQVSSGTPTPCHGSSKLLYGVRTLLIVHTASLPDVSNHSKNLRSHRPYRIIRCKKKYLITQIQTLQRNLLSLSLQIDALGSSTTLVRVCRNTRRRAPQERKC